MSCTDTERDAVYLKTLGLYLKREKKELQQVEFCRIIQNQLCLDVDVTTCVALALSVDYCAELSVNSFH